MESLRLKGQMINGDTIHDMQVQGKDIWSRVQIEPSMVFLAPEQLISKGFKTLATKDIEFTERICVIAMDEAHLLNTWRRSWQKAFMQIIWVGMQFNNVTMIALTVML